MTARKSSRSAKAKRKPTRPPREIPEGQVGNRRPSPTGGAARKRQIAQRQKLDRQILEISEREQQRIGQDLHDGLGQQITGIIFHAHLLHKYLTEKGLKEAQIAAQIVAMLDEAKTQARQIARGLQPVDTAPNGLMIGLDHLATSTSDIYRIECSFMCPDPVVVEEYLIATHLFRIAQEAVTNAFRHGRARKIEIHLRRKKDQLVLEIADDGCGLPKGVRRHKGLGLRFMKYRAAAMGGAVDFRAHPDGGTIVRCKVQEVVR